MTATKKPVKNMARAMLVWKIWAKLTSDAPQGAVPILLEMVIPLPKAFKTRPENY
ncbi:hypothetical protein ME0901_04200 [Lactobacillus delbrueckii subsp. bulgaricus]|uniref:Uncharacterized protein n=1 Tax=Lactobacillus delbrueckii subsp. bulgaricus TaxID=1585 RepID=A0AAV5PJP2_LACDE|nr:hypothetical protein ME0899_04910 [Lactobacillus delbrueckii subsp. bulgaricus]GMB86460.1 hypothetical protein ME0900_08330 [Lactobacillus delbrueckii subsp. bulgaricus]GMB87900.1 hypothetical protein ME0901_04200 [Lactobacillus delbrueckii subsp. bulgaricus]